MTSLVIVESPAKAKTIGKYLGKGYKVLASYGHVRDLIPKEGAVDVNHDFAMHYEPIDRNSKHVEAIAKAMKDADTLLLAPDPDREGEAIAWHLYELLKNRKALKDKTVKRVVFNQITKRAVQEAIENPRTISMDLVDAQQARRALDYLVGFNLSPLLWKKVRRGLSAGRVQSPALRMIVEREEEIEKFIAQEYWSIDAACEKDQKIFKAKLTHYNNEKVEQFTVTDGTTASKVKTDLEKAAKGELTVSNVTRKQRKRNPAAPFITSTLQQEAARKLHFTTARTMQIAQQLYEGIDLGEGAVGLITYMRTDSVTLAAEAVQNIRETIEQQYGKDLLPDTPVFYKTKSKNAQEAHEAIRPTYAHYEPNNIKKYLSADQYKLYKLIWQRTIACQMIPATLNTVSVDLTAGKHTFRATGSTIATPGFMSVYMEGRDDVAEDDDEKILPEMVEGETVKLQEILAEQHFTEPPPRYSEASLVKALEEHGIGRPSTYASIISTLKNREYVTLDNKRFQPTDVGRIVAKFLTEYFTQYVDYDFTAKLEDTLDNIAAGDQDWVPVLKKFWKPFHTLVGEIDDKVKRSDVTHEKIDEKCPDCGGQLSIRLGRTGRFIGCDNYPDCKYTRSLEAGGDEPQEVGRKCPECEHELVYKHGKYGKFIGCSNYPTCKHIEPLNKPKDTGVECPKCNQGEILERRSRRGKVFYSCNRYPDCDYAIWNEPIKKPCQKCHWPIMSLKITKRSGEQEICPECKYVAEKEDK